ncbi:hypothetical protein BLOT_013444 [Blomia tropicalis]|nr:hypothetical protein BLOT_013444 [Blomia tropicalis]
MINSGGVVLVFVLVVIVTTTTALVDTNDDGDDDDDDAGVAGVMQRHQICRYAGKCKYSGNQFMLRNYQFRHCNAPYINEKSNHTTIKV